MQNSQEFSITELSLPKGGGAITGMGEALTPTGLDGMAALSLPLPISAGRGYAPSLTLNYNSGAGNSPFGLGWDCGVMTIRRRTHFGVPHYDKTDTFLGPEGEVLVIADQPRDESILKKSLLKKYQLGYHFYCYRLPFPFGKPFQPIGILAT
ncbi:insecticidal toxin complex protein TcdB2 [Photorhabdus temperata subsp. temperata M1021]|nr:insecticidal toxin complex protein TcdB2 [Photorhabdus temperata subsp. temperata M1021]